VNGSPYLAGKGASLSTTQEILQSAGEGELVDRIEERLKLLASRKGTPLEEAEKQLIAGRSSAIRLQEKLAEFKRDSIAIEDRHVLAAALASGAAHQGQLELPVPFFELDTHSNHEKRHLEAQKKVWESVASIFKLFKSVSYEGTSLFDLTTFMVVSEFSRTPALNAAKGKDHNPFTNSVLLAGKGVRGGQTCGASRLIPRKETETGMPDHIAWPYDYKAQKLATGPDGASFLFPENVVQTVGKIFDRPASFAPVDASVPVIPGVAA
jgi:hypothetical protein